MKIQVGEILSFLSQSSSPGNRFKDYYDLTKGRHKTGYGIGGKGIFNYSRVKEPNQDIYRYPAVIFHSNPYKHGGSDTPWVDIIDADQGFALYYGDNKNAGSSALKKAGNKLISGLMPLYKDPHLRKYAPPILITKQEKIDGKVKGFRSFQGFGVPIHISLVTQRSRTEKNYFTNILIELALFDLSSENNLFDWGWIDLRRDKNISSETALLSAPKSWQRWVREGNSAIESVRRKVHYHKIINDKSQEDMTVRERYTLRKILAYYENSKHSFEGLAAEIAVRVVGRNCRKGWVTPRSSDKGIDFINRIDIDNKFPGSKIVLLGQAKCIKEESSISGKDLARLTARLQRGWFGVFVTTGKFSRKAQLELLEDKYPVILINGQRIAQEVNIILNEENISLNDYLKLQTEWFNNNERLFDAERILDWDFSEDIFSDK